MFQSKFRIIFFLLNDNNYIVLYATIFLQINNFLAMILEPLNNKIYLPLEFHLI